MFFNNKTLIDDRLANEFYSIDILRFYWLYNRGKILMNTKKNVLFLTHSNIFTDARILKTMHVISEITNIDVYGYGIEDNYEKHIGTFASKNLVNININFKNIFKIFHFYKLLKFVKLTWQFYYYAETIRPIIIHVNDWPSLFAGVLIKRKYDSKLIYDAHELESETNGLSRLLSKIVLMLEKFLWKDVDFLICASQHYTRWYIENIGFKENEYILNSPVVFGNPIDLNFISKSKPLNTLNFIYVGFLTSGRGIELLLELFSNDGFLSHLSFLGYGPMQDLVKIYSDKFSNIHYFSPLPHEQVVSFVKNFDYGVSLIENISLSDYYCAPNKLFEYAFSGIPVIASDFPEMKYYVEKHNLGHCILPNIENLKKMINFLENEPQILHNPVNLAEISWDKQALKLSKVYDSLLI